MSYVCTFTVAPGGHLPAQPLPGMRSCAASPAVGRCKCGWQVPGWVTDVADATLNHLYGDLTGAARRFAWPEENR